MDLSGRTIAVTGATGFLGSHIAEVLVARGARVRGVVRSPEKGRWMAERWGVELVSGDILRPDSLARAFEGCDAVVANAALAVRGVNPAWEDFERANVGGCANQLFGAAQASIRRVVLISTVGVYAVRPFVRMTEDHPQLGNLRQARWSLSSLTTNPKYMLSKRLGELRAWEVAGAQGLALTALRPGPIYGSRDVKFTARYREQVRRALVPAPTVRVPHVHAADVALAVAGALENEASAGRAYNVAGDSVSPYRALTAMKAQVGGGLLIPIPLPFWVAYDDSAAARDLGFRSRSVEDGMAEACA